MAAAEDKSRISVARLAKLAMFAGAVVATLATAFTFKAIRVQANDDQWVSHTLEARQQIAGLLASVRGAGTGIRVYLLTHADAQLDEYRANLETIPRQISELSSLTADNPVQRHNVERLKPLIAKRLARLDGYLHGDEPTAAWLRASNQLMTEIHGVVDEMDHEELRLLSLRGAEARANERRTELVSLLGLVSSFGLVILGGWLQRVDARREARQLRMLHIGSFVSNNSTDSRRALQAALDQICEVMGWDAAHAHVLADGRMVSSGIWHLPAGRNMAAFQERA